MNDIPKGTPFHSPPHGCGGHDGEHATMGVAAHDRVKDPVCGMMVDPATTAHKAEHAG